VTQAFLELFVVLVSVDRVVGAPVASGTDGDHPARIVRATVWQTACVVRLQVRSSVRSDEGSRFLAAERLSHIPAEEVVSALPGFGGGVGAHVASAGPSGSELSHSVAPPSQGMCRRSNSVTQPSAQ
jgi:hypothetical protein